MGAQDTARLEFEVASLKASPPPDGRGMTMGCRGGPGTSDPALMACQNVKLSDLVTMAYSISYYQLSAPEWTRGTRYDLRAKLPAGSTKEQMPLMLQALLADRFRLVVHRESREMAKYDLVVAKGGPRFHEASVSSAAKGDGPTGAPGPLKLDKDGYPALGHGRPGLAWMNGRARLYYPEITMESLAGQLSGQLAKTVTDATNLPGKYEISLYWAAEPLNAGTPSAEGEPGPTLMQALQDQLGLRLEGKKGTVEFIVIDSAERTPADN